MRALVSKTQTCCVELLLGVCVRVCDMYNLLFNGLHPETGRINNLCAIVSVNAFVHCDGCINGP